MRLRITLLLLLATLVLTVAGWEEHEGQKVRNHKDAPVAPASDREYKNGPLAPGLYSNGPVLGTKAAWQINDGVEVSDTLHVFGSNFFSLNLTFGVWVDAGNRLCIPVAACIPSTVELGLGYAAFGNEVEDVILNVTSATYHNVVLAAPGNPCTKFCVVYTVTAAAPGTVPLTDNLWITLGNALNKSGGPVYWDENDGIGCLSMGCPSAAQQSNIGVIGSESFTFR